MTATIKFIIKFMTGECENKNNDITYPHNIEFNKILGKKIDGVCKTG